MSRTILRHRIIRQRIIRRRKIWRRKVASQKIPRRSMLATMRDSVDDHIAQWRPLLDDLDADIEGAITRMQKLVKHLRKHKDLMLAKHDLQGIEFDTLHV